MVARQYTDNQKIFFQTAQHWSASYAGGQNPIPEYVAMISKLKADIFFMRASFKDM